MPAIQQLAVFDGLKAHLWQDAGRPAAVPAQTMTGLRVWGGRQIHVTAIVTGRAVACAVALVTPGSGNATCLESITA